MLVSLKKFRQAFAWLASREGLRYGQRPLQGATSATLCVSAFVAQVQRDGRVAEDFFIAASMYVGAQAAVMVYSLTQKSFTWLFNCPTPRFEKAQSLKWKLLGDWVAVHWVVAGAAVGLVGAILISPPNHPRIRLSQSTHHSAIVIAANNPSSQGPAH